MTEDQKIEFAEKLSNIEARSKSNSHRLDEHDEAIKEQNSLIAAIKELAVETKYMREDLNSTIKRRKSGRGKVGKVQMVIGSRISHDCIRLFSCTGRTKIGGDPNYLSNADKAA